MYHNPVKVIETNDWQNALTESLVKLGVKNPLIITSIGNIKRNNLLKIFDKNNIFSDIVNNPTFESTQQAIGFSRDKSIDSVIALGGGSVMDTAKTVMAAIANNIYSITKLLAEKLMFPHRIPAIFIPTTHGTASEVTMWGTLWDMTAKRKHSLAHEALYPDIAILDGTLTLNLPMNISIATTLDALSHSFEAIWNKNANYKSTYYAIEAINIILAETNRFKEKPNSVDVRNRLLKASNLAGLAFSNTKTAAAHSMSYPLTMFYNIPHGVACSMPIIPLLRINEPAIEAVLEEIYIKLHIPGLVELEELISQIPNNYVDFTLSDWGVKLSEIDDIVEYSFTKSRMENNIVELQKSDIKSIFESLL